MIKNIEIEFKTKIDEKTYHDMLKEFNLENNVFRQTNYYFDTQSFDLSNKKIVLRIRQKKNDYFKLTLKSEREHEAYESHHILTKEKALSLLETGFDTKKYFPSLNYYVIFKASLVNYRVSTPYENGVLFFDRSDYHGQTDYEIEYECDNYNEGKKTFNKFLQQRNIPNLPTKRKSERALEPLKNKWSIKKVQFALFFIHY